MCRSRYGNALQGRYGEGIGGNLIPALQWVSQLLLEIVTHYTFCVPFVLDNGEGHAFDDDFQRRLLEWLKMNLEFWLGDYHRSESKVLGSVFKVRNKRDGSHRIFGGV